MYFIVETSQQLSKLPISDVCFIQVIPSSEKSHPALTRCSLVYYNNGSKGYIFPVNHSEGFSLEIAQIQSFINSHKKVYLLDKKFHSYFLDLNNTVDLNFIRLDQGIEENKLECDTVIHRDFYYNRAPSQYINELIPITKHYEKYECLYKKVESLFDLERDYEILNKASYLYNWVETQGIAVDNSKLISTYHLTTPNLLIKDNIVYSYYNMYNTTGRPSNSFSNINFVAVPKTPEFRECFIPRFDYLVEFDFDAYHLRLIAQLIDYKFTNPQESIHTQLGKLYFSKDELTQEEYNKSKEISFKQLYGGIDDQYKNIEFFSRLDYFIENSWNIYKRNGSYILPTGKLLRKSQEINKLKLFNYTIQNLETKNNIFKIEKIKNFIESKKCKSKLVLITYDAFLFDYSIDDGKEFLIEIKKILCENGFAVKHKYSKNYNF